MNEGVAGESGAKEVERNRSLKSSDLKGSLNLKGGCCRFYRKIQLTLISPTLLQRL